MSRYYRQGLDERIAMKFATDPDMMTWTVDEWIACTTQYDLLQQDIRQTHGKMLMPREPKAKSTIDWGVPMDIDAVRYKSSFRKGKR